MNFQIVPSLKLPLLAAGIAALLFSLASVAGMAVSAQGFRALFTSADPAETAATEEARPPEARTYRCGGCGVIESIRPIERNEYEIAAVPGRVSAMRDYAITIRMRDGTMRVITDANPAKWKNGERVQIIAGLGE